MGEKIIIENFGGIKKASIKLNRINIFIGPQASGKSVVAKLVYFFRSSIANIIEGGTKSKEINQITQEEYNRFTEYFPLNNLGITDFSIKYLIDKEYILIQKQSDNIGLYYSEKIIHLLDKVKMLHEKGSNQNGNYQPSSYFETVMGGIYRHIKDEFPSITGYKSTFIPTGRSFFAQVEVAIFSLVQNKIPIDAFLINFGAAYESVRSLLNQSVSDSKGVSQHIAKLTSSIIKGRYIRENQKDYIVHKGGRKVEAKKLSSGQQETLPLTLILTRLAYLPKVSDAESMIFIEEPEASIFPESQLQIVKLIATVFNVARNPEHFLITTHSPYILTAFNNLIQAGLMIEEGIDKKKVHKVIPEFEILKPGVVSAFMMKNGQVKNIMDKESGLIDASLIDDVSEDIALEFDKMLDLYDA